MKRKKILVSVLMLSATMLLAGCSKVSLTGNNSGNNTASKNGAPTDNSGTPPSDGGTPPSDGGSAPAGNGGAPTN